MRLIQTIIAVLTAFIFYGSVSQMYRRRRKSGQNRAVVRRVRPHDELRLTNL